MWCGDKLAFPLILRLLVLKQQASRKASLEWESSRLFANLPPTC